MGFFDFLISSKDKIYNIPKDSSFNLGDAVCGDKVKLWKPEGKVVISFYNKEIDGSGAYPMMGKFQLIKLSKQLDEGMEYVASVHKVLLNAIQVKVKIILENEPKEKEIGKNESEESKKRYERLYKRVEIERKLAEEERAKLQIEYDKVNKKHRLQLEDFQGKFDAIEKNFNKSELDILKLIIEKEVEKVEVKCEKRVDTFYNRSEKWQESEKGVLYEDITNELENIQSDMEYIFEYDMLELIKKQEQ